MSVELNIGELNAGHVYMSNPGHVAAVIADMIKGGKDALHMVADFDMTLSKYTHNGCRCDTSHGIIDECPYLSEDFQQQARANRIHYQTIEFDTAISQDEKLPYMVEWWTLSHKLLVAQKKLTREMLHRMAINSNCVLREGCGWLLDTLSQKNVPVLIFSAGVGDLIKHVIASQHSLTDNVKIVANFMTFDENGLLDGFQDKVIHCLNKNEMILADTKYFDKLQARRNVILLGDSLGDLQMADGARNTSSILKIGFLNRNVSESLDTYMRSYDIVIVEDDSLDVVNAIVKNIVAS